MSNTTNCPTCNREISAALTSTHKEAERLDCPERRKD